MKLKKSNQTIQVENVELRRLWQTSKEEKHGLKKKFKIYKVYFNKCNLNCKLKMRCLEGSRTMMQFRRMKNLLYKRDILLPRM